MNQTEKLKLANKLTSDLRIHEGYVKGYGSKLCRVMDKDHNPLYNINKEVVDFLFQIEKLKLDGLFYKLNLEN